jgi:hypothetical protein
MEQMMERLLSEMKAERRTSQEKMDSKLKDMKPK